MKIRKIKAAAAGITLLLTLCMAGCGSQSAGEATVSERMKTLTVEGCPLPVPCQVGDIGDGLSLGNGSSTAGRTVCNLMYNGNKIGDLNLDGELVSADERVDMSEGYEDAWIMVFSMNSSSGNFVMSGVTFDSTMQEIINLWGEADSKTDTLLTYTETDSGTEKTIARVLFQFDENGSMEKVTLTTYEK